MVRKNSKFLTVNKRANIVWRFIVVLILLLFCLHRRFIFDSRSTDEAYWSLFDFINSVAMCLAEFI